MLYMRFGSHGPWRMVHGAAERRVSEEDGQDDARAIAPKTIGALHRALSLHGFDGALLLMGPGPSRVVQVPVSRTLCGDRHRCNPAFRRPNSQTQTAGGP